MNIQEIEKGIASYGKQRKALKRWIKMCGGLSSSRFDDVMYRRGANFSYKGRDGALRPKIRKLTRCAISGDSFILGGLSGSERDWNLELLQYMCMLGEVSAAKIGDDIVYELVP